jgi:hypothetical protein
MAKKKVNGYKYKMLKPADYDMLKGMTQEELEKSFVKARKNEQAAKKNKKEDEDLVALNDKIKKYRSENMPKKVSELQDEIKEIKKEVDVDIYDELEDKKALSKGHSNIVKEFTETQSAILEILRMREI